MWLIHRKFQREQVPSLTVFLAYSARASGWRWYSPQRLDLGGFGEVVATRGARDRKSWRDQQFLCPQIDEVDLPADRLFVVDVRHARRWIELLRTTRRRAELTHAKLRNKNKEDARL